MAARKASAKRTAAKKTAAAKDHSKRKDLGASGEGHVALRPPDKRALPLRSYRFDVVTVNSSGAVTDRRRAQARYYVEDISGVALEMVEIPGGTFLMGNTDAGVNQAKREYERHGHDADGASKQSRWEIPQHSVSVPTFYMGKFEVTQAQWRAVAVCQRVNRDLVSDPSNFKGDSLPVQQLSWEDAIEFCERLSRAIGRTYRLPTEAEWEYAARGGTTTAFHFGDTVTSEFVNYDGNYPYGSAPKGIHRQTPTPVGSLGYPNAFGLHDMHGNLWEWCTDYWHESYDGAPTDGSSWDTAGETRRRVLRGGSYHHDGNHCRAATRVGFPQDRSSPSTGFRVAAARKPPTAVHVAQAKASGSLRQPFRPPGRRRLDDGTDGRAVLQGAALRRASTRTLALHRMGRRPFREAADRKASSIEGR